MKILVALDNNIIKEHLDKKYEGIVYKYDIDYMEGVIEFLSKNDEEYILVTKDSLKGNLDSKMYIKQLRLANNKVRVIYIVSKLDSEYKEFLFANEILNILEGDNIDINALEECIEENRQIVYKMSDNNGNLSLGEPALNYKIENQIIPKELIAVYGTSGSGKSVVSSIVSKDICKRLNISIALLDMDIQNPSIDILNNIEGSNNTLSQVVEDVDKMNDINHIIDKYMIKDRNNKNLWYMTNNTSIFECQNKLSNKYYEQIYASINLKYDYTIVDLPASPFLDVVQYTVSKATKVIFVVNPNYVSIRQAIKYLDLLSKMWDIPSSRIYLIINKIQKNSLDSFQIQSLLKDYRIIGQIGYNKDMDSYINGTSSDMKMDFDIEGMYNVLGVKNIDNYQGNYLKKLWRKNNVNKPV